MGLILFDRFLFAAEAEGLSNEQARGVVVRISEAGFLCFAIGKASEAERSAESEPLSQLGRIEDFGALPWSQANKSCHARSVLRLSAASEAVLTFVRRVKAWITLLDVGRLSENLPIDRLGCAIVILLRRSLPRPIQLSIESQPQHVEIGGRRVIGS